MFAGMNAIAAQRAEAPESDPQTQALVTRDGGLDDAPIHVMQEPMALDALEKMRTHYRRVRGFASHFRLTLHARLSQQDLRAEGLLRFAYPASLRMEFLPGRSLYTSDGITVRLFAPVDAALSWRSMIEDHPLPASTRAHGTWLEIPTEGTPLALLSYWMNSPPRPTESARMVAMPDDVGEIHGDARVLELRSANTPLLDRVVVLVRMQSADEATIERVMLFDFEGNYANVALTEVRNGVQSPALFRMENAEARRDPRPLHIIRP